MILQMVWNECVRFGGHVTYKLATRSYGWKYYRRL
jgi:hypothetical protein